MMNNELKDFAAKFRERFAPKYIRDLAADGNHCLSTIDRVESFRGDRMYMPHPSGEEGRRVVIQRALDYQRVRWTGRSAAVAFSDCDKAIRTLGARLERCLALDAHDARDFVTGLAVDHGGVDGIRKWEGAPVTLYSLGPCPRLLEPGDGIQIRRVRPEFGRLVLTGEAFRALGGHNGQGGERLRELERQYGDRLYEGNMDGWQVDDGEPTYEVCFAYYANTGPTLAQPRGAL